MAAQIVDVESVVKALQEHESICRTPADEDDWRNDPEQTEKDTIRLDAAAAAYARAVRIITENTVTQDGEPLQLLPLLHLVGQLLTAVGQEIKPVPNGTLEAEALDHLHSAVAFVGRMVHLVDHARRIEGIDATQVAGRWLMAAIAEDEADTDNCEGATVTAIRAGV